MSDFSNNDLSNFESSNSKKMVKTRHGSVTHQSHDGDNLDSVWSMKVSGKKPSKGDSASASVNSSPLKFLMTDEDGDSDVPCKVCPKFVGNKGVQCDRCKGWVHVQCSDLSKDEYDSLSRIASVAVQYQCPPCRKEIKEGHGTDRAAIQEAKIDTLMKTVQALQQQNLQILKLLNQNETKMMDSTKVVQGQLNQVQTKMSETLLEEKEKEKRKNNAIISNISESKLQNSDERMREDREKVADLLRTIVEIEEPEIVNVVRLGKTDKDGKPRAKPRLLKVVFKSEEKKREVMKKARGLNEGVEDNNKKIFINHDETDAERKAGYELRQKLRAKKQQTGEQDWIIRNGEVVKRRQAAAVATEEANENEETTKQN